MTVPSDPLPATIATPWWRSAGAFTLVPLVVGVGAALLCAQACDASLGLFFGGVIFAAILIPPLAITADTWLARGVNTLTVVAGIAGVWFFAGVKEEGTTASQWAGCAGVLAAYAAAAAGFAAMLRVLRLAPIAASALTVIVGLAWMTWPIWLAPQIEGPAGPMLANWMVPAHPLITINGLLQHLGIWNDQSIAYHLTKLGNEVPYSLPATPWPAVAVHGGLAAGFVMLAAIPPMRRRKRATKGA